MRIIFALALLLITCHISNGQQFEKGSILIGLGGNLDRENFENNDYYYTSKYKYIKYNINSEIGIPVIKKLIAGISFTTEGSKYQNIHDSYYSNDSYANSRTHYTLGGGPFVQYYLFSSAKFNPYTQIKSSFKYTEIKHRSEDAYYNSSGLLIHNISEFKYDYTSLTISNSIGCLYSASQNVGIYIEGYYNTLNLNKRPSYAGLNSNKLIRAEKMEYGINIGLRVFLINDKVTE